MLQCGVEQTLNKFVYKRTIHCTWNVTLFNFVVVNTEVFKTKLTVDVLNYDQLF